MITVVREAACWEEGRRRVDGTDLSQDINRFRGLCFSQRLDTSLVLCKVIFCTFKSQARYLGRGEVFVIER